jgi:hypothetical protein
MSVEVGVQSGWLDFAAEAVVAAFEAEQAVAAEERLLGQIEMAQHQWVGLAEEVVGIQWAVAVEELSPEAELRALPW